MSKEDKKRKREIEDNQNEKGDQDDEAALTSWKSNCPLIYDLFRQYNNEWPSISINWGDITEETKYWKKQNVYYSCRTDATYSSETKSWEGLPNSLVQVTLEVPKAHCTIPGNICRSYAEETSSSSSKAVIHPGEVSRMRCCPQMKSILVTHSDIPELFLWNMKTQPNREIAENAVASIPDLILAGHTDVSEFALDCCIADTKIASGGKDNKVLIWQIEDYNTSLSSGSTLMASTEFIGHTSVVEDVQFQPKSSNVLCSGGDDKLCLLWDSRAGTSPTNTIKFSDDVNTLSWNPFNTNLLLIGTSDGKITLADIRKIGKVCKSTSDVIQSIITDQGPIMNLSWALHTNAAGHLLFASSGETKAINVWDSNDFNGNGKVVIEPRFRHLGHRGYIEDFQWNYDSPYTMASFSSDSSGMEGGGGSIHVWRMQEYIFSRNKNNNSNSVNSS